MARTKGSDDLFRLIHSLSSAEKRYFTKFAQRHTTDGNKYLQLFNAIKAQKEFEEASLKKKFKAYPVMKVYLLEMVLKSLVISSESPDSADGLLMQLLLCRTLIRRGLREKALQLLKKYAAIARQEGQYAIEAMMLYQYIFNTYLDRTAKKFEARIKLFGEVKAALENYLQHVSYNEQASRLTAMHWNKTGRNGKPGLPDSYFGFDAGFILAKKGNTPTNEWCRLHLLPRYYTVMGDYEMALYYARHRFELLKLNAKSPHRNIYYGNYTDTLTTLLAVLMNNHKDDEALDILMQEEHKKMQTEGHRIYHFQQLSSMKCNLLWRTGRHPEGEYFIEQNKQALILDKNSTPVAFNRRNILGFKILFEFSNQNYAKAILSINEFINLFGREKLHFSKDCEIMRILIQVELKNFEIMKRLIKNILRNGSPGLSSFNKQFLSLLRGLNAANEKEVFRQLNEKFPPLAGDEEIFSSLSLRDWIWSKHNGLPLKDSIHTHKMDGEKPAAG